jgi:hypothetical protein
MIRDVIWEKCRASEKDGGREIDGAIRNGPHERESKSCTGVWRRGSALRISPKAESPSAMEYRY